MSATPIDMSPIRPQNRRSVAEAWWAPVIAKDRVAAWAATRDAIHAAIQRARWAAGYDDPTYSALGDHVYEQGPGRRTP